MPQMAAYAALLLHGHEFSLLNCTFASMPELAVDEKMLKEIKEVRECDSDNLSLTSYLNGLDLDSNTLKCT